MKPEWRRGLEAEKTPLPFGADPDKGLDSGIL